MAETEKITINMNPVDLGKIDLLVARGYFSNRTDFIKNAIRDLLEKHDEDFKMAVRDMQRTQEETAPGIKNPNTWGMGVMVELRKDLEKLQQAGQMKDVFVIGLWIVPNDISPELARATLRNITVFGPIRASQSVKEALADRIK
jgi:Arc/MetJ-type ribon-helix-helix transcriptional regulator